MDRTIHIFCDKIKGASEIESSTKQILPEIINGQVHVSRWDKKVQLPKNMTSLS